MQNIASGAHKIEETLPLESHFRSHSSDMVCRQRYQETGNFTLAPNSNAV